MIDALAKDSRSDHRERPAPAGTGWLPLAESGGVADDGLLQTFRLHGRTSELVLLHRQSTEKRIAIDTATFRFSRSARSVDRRDCGRGSIQPNRLPSY